MDNLNEQLIDEKLKQKFKEYKFVSKQAEDIFNEFSSGQFDVNEIEKNKRSVEYNMKNKEVNKTEDKIFKFKFNYKSLTGILSVAACATIVIGIGLGVGTNMFKENKTGGNNVIVNEGNTVTITKNLIKSPLATASSSDYNGVMEICKSEVITKVYGINTKNNMQKSYNLTEDINSSIVEILDILKSVKPDDIKDLGSEGFLTLLDEKFSINCESGAIIEIVYNDSNDTLLVNIDRRADRFVYTYSNKEINTKVAKLLEKCIKFEKKYDNFEAETYTTLIPTEWKGKYNSKIVYDYENEIAYDLLYTTNNTPICGFAVVKYENQNTVFNTRKNYGINGVVLNATKDNYLFYFAIGENTNYLKSVFGNNFEDQLREIENNMNPKDIASKLNEIYSNYNASNNMNNNINNSISNTTNTAIGNESTNNTTTNTINNSNIQEQPKYTTLLEYKGRTFKNEDYNTTPEGFKEYCELIIAEDGKPTLKIGYKSDNNTECYFQTTEIKNYQEDVAAGTTYMKFDFSAWTPAGDTTGNAIIAYNSSTKKDQEMLDLPIMNISATVNYGVNKDEYKNIEVTLEYPYSQEQNITLTKIK